MVDNISLLISHGLLLVAAWRLLARPDLDSEAPSKPPIGGNKPGA